MRRPARLWRSGRERAAWRAALAAADTAEQLAHAAFTLTDRAGPMLQRFIALADEAAKWEALEAERAQAEAAKAAREEPVRAAVRPVMIRTGKCKTDDGVKVVLKALGREPFPSGRAAAAMDAASPETAAACRWGYQCSVCLLAGDLLCCEHAQGCNVSVHLECSGCQGFPPGPWVCANHDDRELKTRIRRRAPGGPRAGAQDSDPDSDATAEASDDSDASDDGRGGG
ncbi:hypothetical protein H632_c4859p0, partial [Helicosporidium sp. ATCC 50920]